MTALWHPFADMAAVEAARRAGPGPGHRLHRLGRAPAAAISTSRPGCGSSTSAMVDKSIAQAAGEQAERLAAHSIFGDVANATIPGAGRARGGAGSRTRQQGVLHLGRLGQRRHRREDGAQARGPARSPGAAGHRGTRSRPTTACTWPVRRWRASTTTRRATASLDADVVRVPWDDAVRAGRDSRPPRRAGRRLLLRARHRGGWGVRCRRGLPPGRPTRCAGSAACSSWLTRSSAASARRATGSPPTRFGLEPDLTLVAKGITSGYVPLGAVARGTVGVGAVLVAGRCLAARLHLLGSRGRGGGRAWPTSTSWSRSGSPSGRSTSRRSWRKRWNRCARMPLVCRRPGRHRPARCGPARRRHPDPCAGRGLARAAGPHPRHRDRLRADLPVACHRRAADHPARRGLTDALGELAETA